jgi:hypothetical protein
MRLRNLSCCGRTHVCSGSELISESELKSESEIPFRFRWERHSAFPFLRNSCKTGLYGIFERIKLKAWNFAQPSESMLSLIYDLNPPTPGAEESVCTIRRRWLFFSCVSLNLSISSHLASVIQIPAPHTCMCSKLWKPLSGFPNVSRLHVLSCLVHELLCLVPNIYDNLNLIH